MIGARPFPNGVAAPADGGNSDSRRQQMDTNRVPVSNPSDNPTGCCPRFSPEGWDAQELHFEGKPFVRAITHSRDYVPQDMAPVFGETFGAIQTAGAWDDLQALVLSHDLSPSEAEHLFAVSTDVPGTEMVRLAGDFRTKLFEGPYEQVPQWLAAFEDELAAEGLTADPVYFYYTTCPKCAAAYGKNYVVAVARLRS
jgi:hypothetical protein